MSSRYRVAWARRLPARLLRAALQLVAWAVRVGLPRVTGREHLARQAGAAVLAAELLTGSARRGLELAARDPNYALRGRAIRQRVPGEALIAVGVHI